ncbi:hypothetical protein HUW51_21280 [Adhaeribacter swui]|uniref:Uncharacterized protein n=1 Tax=Adhaeribacter swui TaxID=2086471 RepID=A0A7G7GD92_9BACT|nr:hypothetical protein [Adhaeribacter swui]QNF35126.1 hypothetical protein HUW51_21280 [Adhaeribacter swui]
MDKHPLVHIVNRIYKLRIYFEGSFEFNPRPNALLYWKSIEPFRGMITKVELPQFLKSNILLFYDHIYNVQDIIQYTSHITCGVHSQPAKTERELNLQSWIADAGISYMSIRAICVVSLNALLPLELEIKKDLQ